MIKISKKEFQTMVEGVRSLCIGGCDFPNAVKMKLNARGLDWTQSREDKLRVAVQPDKIIRRKPRTANKQSRLPGKDQMIAQSRSAERAHNARTD